VVDEDRRRRSELLANTAARARSTAEHGRSSRSRHRFAGRSHTAAAARSSSTSSRERRPPGRVSARASQARRRSQSRRWSQSQSQRQYPDRYRHRPRKTISGFIESLAARPHSSRWVGARLHRAFSPRRRRAARLQSGRHSVSTEGELASALRWSLAMIYFCSRDADPAGAPGVAPSVAAANFLLEGSDSLDLTKMPPIGPGPRLD
jgi:hypothetical protein